MTPPHLGIPSTLPKGAPPVRHYLKFSDLSADEYRYLNIDAGMTRLLYVLQQVFIQLRVSQWLPN